MVLMVGIILLMCTFPEALSSINGTTAFKKILNSSSTGSTAGTSSTSSQSISTVRSTTPGSDQQTNLTSSLNDTSELLSDSCTADEVDTEMELRILERLMSNYNKQMLPGQRRVQAFVEITVNDITRVSELDSFFELDMFYSELWFDSRLSYVDWPEARCVKNITLDLDYLKRVWTPNICIVNSKSAVIHASPSDNVFLIVYQDGKVWKNCRMMLKAPCNIDLRAFPFDTQTCTLIFESYSFNSQRLTLEWFEETAITLSRSSQQLADFHLVDYRVDRSLVTYPNGQWDQLTATFVFERRYGFFIWQAFIPSYMTIFVAWITFFMDPKELATRATLGISAFLAIMLQFGQVQQNQPRVSYMKAMDVWMLGAISFLFGALAELAVISYMIRSDRPCNATQQRFLINDQQHSLLPRTSGSNSRRRAQFGTSTTAMRSYASALSSLNRSSSSISSKFRRSYPLSNGYVPNYQARCALRRSAATTASASSATASAKHQDNGQQLLPKHLRCNCPPSYLQNDVSSHDESGTSTKDHNCNNRLFHDDDQNEKSLLRKKTPPTTISSPIGSSGQNKKRVSKWTKFRALLTAYNVDKFFLIVYLPTFLVFNFIFWTHYL